MIYYLKTTDEASLWLALEEANLAVRDYDPEDELNIRPADLDMETEWEPSGSYEWRFTGTALDIIGSIYKETGVMLTDAEGMEYPEMAPIDGFHANMIATTEADLSAITVASPATPYRKWAGM